MINCIKRFDGATCNNTTMHYGKSSENENRNEVEEREKENVMMPRSLNLSCLNQCFSSAADQNRRWLKVKVQVKERRNASSFRGAEKAQKFLMLFAETFLSPP